MLRFWHIGLCHRVNMLLQVKRLFQELKVDFLAVELDEVGNLPAPFLHHLHHLCCTSLSPQADRRHAESLCKIL